MRLLIHWVSAAALAGFAGNALCAVSAEEARQLGTTLTPWGAEVAGNKEGTIPAYGKDVVTKLPAGYDPKRPGVLPDPFAADRPLYVITAANMDKYAAILSEGAKTALKKYPTMRMDVYPSRRSADYPKYVADNTVKNATACKGVNNGMKLEGCYGGLPFPIPKSGLEVVWNHIANYTAYAWAGTLRSYLVDASGAIVLQGENVGTQESPYYDPKRTGVVPSDEVFWRIRIDMTGPARRAGEKLVIVDSLDMLGVGRRAWQYLPGQRRVKLAPDLAYDTPNPQTGGSQLMDESKVFLGAPDRYDWKLLGKKEMLIPYNNFKFIDPVACAEKIKFTKNHPNPDCVRWELHRVWAVEGTLKAGSRHVYPRRVLYFDEDAPGAGMADGFDSTGKIYRSKFAIFYPLYNAKGLMSDQSYGLDFTTGAYSTTPDMTDTGGQFVVEEPKGSRYYSPDAMAAEGVR